MLVLNGDTIQTLNLDQFVWHYQKNKYPIEYAGNNGRCCGMMLFHKNVLNILPREGMIDDFVYGHDELMNWYQTDDPYFDMGTPEGLEKARKYVGA